MNPLTKEQVERMESNVSTFGWSQRMQDEFKELLRGYRAWLAEVKRLQGEIESKRNHIAYLKREGLKTVGPELTLKELEARLAALQAEVTTTREVVK